MIVGLMALVAMAGCAGDTSSLDDNNEAPSAELSTNKDVAWDGESIEFDASQSSDPDGNVTEWRFDFGDGTEHVAKDEDDAEISHTYARGGEYTVTVTVKDDGGEQAGSKTDTTSTVVTVNERLEVVGTVVETPTNQSETNQHDEPFEVYEGADRFELDATVESTLAAGASEITLKVVDPNGDVVDEDTVTVGATDNESVELSGMLTEQGTYQVQILAESGSAAVHGELRTYYAMEEF